MNELANALAEATLRKIKENGGKLNQETLYLVRKTGDFACLTDGTCDKVKQLATLLRDWVINLIQNENGPRLSGMTSEVLEILRHGYSLYLR